ADGRRRSRRLDRPLASVALASPAGARAGGRRRDARLGGRLAAGPPQRAPEPLEESRPAWLRSPPLLIATDPPVPQGRLDALGVRMAAAVGVVLGSDQHMRAHRVQVVAAERAAIARRLVVPGRPDRPPLRLLEPRHRRRRTLRDVVDTALVADISAQYAVG